ncbi:hypothetical protein [Thalassotalea sp. ND16A]|uniref:hypothetical protein n=1 Tax=Thalassotalea sp. ND16A TaxID=1535422 RepID=UPI00051D150A|nr:hypothetical protein [Thalassotalea sp. ND16A]KGJ92401.1 hypothetical protein ND16A_1579 [Thalassotalea sp. ND16A]
MSTAALAEEVLSEAAINHIAQQFIDFHKTEAKGLLQTVLSPELTVIVTQGSNGYGFVLKYSKSEYIDYLRQGHKSRSRIGTDVAFISSELLGNREAKIILRYRSKKLNKYVWMEGIISLEKGQAKVIQIEEYT